MITIQQARAALERLAERARETAVDQSFLDRLLRKRPPLWNACEACHLDPAVKTIAGHRYCGYCANVALEVLEDIVRRNRERNPS